MENCSYALREHKCVQDENANGSSEAVGETAKSHGTAMPVLGNVKAAAAHYSKRRHGDWEWKKMTERNVVSG